MLVAEGDAVVDVVADRLHARPAGRRAAEQRPGGVGKPVGVAVAAAQQEDEHVVRQVLDRVLLGVRHDRVGQAGVADQEVRRDRQPPLGRHDARADVAEAVAVVARLDRRVEADLVRPLDRSGRRDGWTLSTSSIGVGCGHS